MSTSITAAGAVVSRWARAADWVELTKPKISLLVLVTVAMSSFVSQWGNVDLARLAHTLVGVVFIAASASAINQLLEKDVDSRMTRTRSRPLPAGRLSVANVVWFAALTAVVGHAYSLVYVNLQAAIWGLVTWVIYGWIYTPLKRITALNTVVGAVSGATPILIGWTATGAAIDLRATALFVTLFLWQFPHFMAIAWLYRDEYAAAGIRMLTVVDPTGTGAGIQAVISALALLPVSLIPALYVAAPGASWFAALAFALGVGQLVFAVMFFAVRTRTTARWLLRASLVYLPALLALLMLLPWF